MISILLGLVQFAAAADRPFRLVSDERHEVLASHIPDSGDKVLNGIRRDPRLVIYTEGEMPKAYQDWAGGLPGIHSPSYNISAAKPREPFGNPNVEFPWGKPAGTEVVPDGEFSTFKFMLLPEGKPIEISKKYLPGDRRPSFVWSFPEDSVMGEVLQLYHDELYFTFEVRLRRKVKGEWRVSVYRPFASLKDLREFCAANRHELSTEDVRISQSHQIFKGDSTTTSLGKMPEGLVRKALSRDFVNVLGSEWSGDSFAPTTKDGFGIVPRNYQAATIAVSTKSCARCHESTLKHANDFDSFRDWYGRVRGSDGIFSFHPFEPSCISYSGIYQGAEIRKSFLDHGIVKMVD